MNKETHNALRKLKGAMLAEIAAKNAMPMEQICVMAQSLALIAIAEDIETISEAVPTAMDEIELIRITLSNQG